MNIINIEARDIPDAWFQCVYNILEHGRTFTIDRGSYTGHKRLEFDYITFRIKYPMTDPLLPQIPEHYGIPNPVADDYLDGYLPYLMTGETKPGESYTYGQRICKASLHSLQPIDWDTSKEILIHDHEVWNNDNIISSDKSKPDEFFVNQLELMIWTYKNKGHRNNQMVLQVGQPSDMLLQDPPCLRQIDTRIQDGKLHFFPHFRSWDLWNGMPANLAAIEIMKQYASAEIGVENGEIIASTKGLHIYDYAFDIGKVLRMKEDIILK